MAAVIAAALAAFLAGGIALYREHRLESRRLMVGARILDSALAEAQKASTLAASGNFSWDAFTLILDQTDFENTWAEHRGVLAGHLGRSDWETVQRAALDHLVMQVVEKDSPPNEREWGGILETHVATLEKARTALDEACECRRGFG